MAELTTKFAGLLDVVRRTFAPPSMIFKCLSGQRSYDVSLFWDCILSSALANGLFRAKLSLYAGFEASLDGHKKVLEDRDKDLDEVRQDLLRNSGSVVG